MRIARDLAKTFLRRRGYEIYRRPHLPKGIDPYESLRSHWPQWRPRTIFDVGANVGQTVARLRPLFPDAEIFAFEPVPQTCVKLRENVRDDSRTHVHCLALGERCGTAWIRTFAQSDLNSLNPGIAAAPADAGSRVQIQLRTLGDVCAEHQISHIDLLKIDVEGFELQVLDGAEPLLRRHAIDFVLVEAGLMPGEPRFTPLSSLVERLRPHGFWLTGIFEQYGWRFAQGAEFCNALFALERNLTCART